MSKVIFDKIIWNNRDNRHKVTVNPDSLEDEDEYEIIPIKEIHKILVMGSIKDPQGYFAWEYFKSARWVRVEWGGTVKNGTPNFDEGDTPNFDEDDIQNEDIQLYHVHVTYPSPEEQLNEDMFGFDYDD